MTHVEICIECSSIDEALKNAKAAALGGANRIECCSAMNVGGLTPDLDTMKELVDAVGGKLEIVAMIRPRSGDFVFTRAERLNMLTQAEHIIALGVDGIVFGSIEDGAIDETFCEELAVFASYNGVLNTFHRAFDALDEPEENIPFLLETRFQRVLTAGAPWGGSGNAIDGLDQIRRYADLAPELEWVVGGGVSEANARAIVERLQGVRFSLHAYSSVLENGLTSAQKVRQLVDLSA